MKKTVKQTVREMNQNFQQSELKEQLVSAFATTKELTLDGIQFVGKNAGSALKTSLCYVNSRYQHHLAQTKVKKDAPVIVVEDFEVKPETPALPTDSNH